MDQHKGVENITKANTAKVWLQQLKAMRVRKIKESHLQMVASGPVPDSSISGRSSWQILRRTQDLESPVCLAAVPTLQQSESARPVLKITQQ